MQKIQEQLKETQKEQKNLQVELNKLLQEIKKNKSQQSTNINDDCSIVSQSGIDYTRLRNFLLAGEWEKANTETDVIIKRLWRTHQTSMSDNESDDEIIQKTLCNIPCEDLQIIDSLWLKYSHGNFGFSVQKSIYDECEKNLDFSKLEIFVTFIFYRMVWYSKNYAERDISVYGRFRQKVYDQNSNFFAIQNYIKGCLPRISWLGYLEKEHKWVGMNSYLELLERLVECKNQNIHDTQNNDSIFCDSENY